MSDAGDDGSGCMVWYLWVEGVFVCKVGGVQMQMQMPLPDLVDDARA